MGRRIAIVGGGWAGLAAAVAATSGGHAVTLFEAARTLGGRARTVEVSCPDGTTALLDNGQHILIGAYLETLRLMETVGVRPADVLLRLPLVMQHADGQGLAFPDWPTPLDALSGIVGARGWSWRDKLSLLRAAAGWQLAGFRCDPEASVTDLTRGLTRRVFVDLVEPLCVAALNTPAERSSGEVFLRVMRDALFGRGHAGWGGSNLLLPRQDLGALLPHAARDWLASRGAALRAGWRVQAVEREADGWRIDDERYDDVVLACPSTEAARLAESTGRVEATWIAEARGLAFEAIATVYATGGPRLPLPMLALRTGPDAPAQFVFDRGQLGGPAGLLAFVVSASADEKQSIEEAVLAQAAALDWQLKPLRTIVEKRATFACVPGLRRPGSELAPGLWACGDYVAGPYPATLEGAVRSALEVVERISTAR